ncbi:hypothetical protein DQ244_10800 [Blastococcus sp. TBT05-19]|nr:hypothetical protein DQ244_10800 [Blastococcus sp. TBT05-19]
MVAVVAAGAVMASDLPAIAAPAPSPTPVKELDSGATSAPDAVSARAIARMSGRTVEIIGERTETSST